MVNIWAVNNRTNLPLFIYGRVGIILVFLIYIWACKNCTHLSRFIYRHVRILLLAYSILICAYKNHTCLSWFINWFINYRNGTCLAWLIYGSV